MMTSTPDLTGWFTKHEAATTLGVTRKSIERYIKAGKLAQRFRPNPGTAPIGVYLPEDVMALKAELDQTRHGTTPPRVLPAAPNGNGAQALALTPAPEVPATATILSLFEAFFEKSLSRTSPTVSTTALFLTVDEAAAYSGLPTRDLRQAIKTGELSARHTVRSGWRILRTDLDALTSASPAVPPARPSSASTEYEPALPGLDDPSESEE